MAVQPDAAPEVPADSPRPESDQSVPSVTDSLREAIAQPDQSASSSPEDQRGGDDTEKKPRIERRVESLIDKLKAQGQQPVDPSQLYGDEPIFTPEEIQSGQFDPNAVQQRLIQREQKVQAQAAQQAIAAVKYESSVKEHLADMDEVKKQLGDDPVLDRLVAKQYDALNHLVDPRTGTRVFVPQVKMSDIYNDFKQAMDKKATAVSADVQAKVQSQAQEQAVPVSVSQSPSQDLAGDAALEKARQSGRTEDWAEVLKRRIAQK